MTPQPAVSGSERPKRLRLPLTPRSTRRKDLFCRVLTGVRRTEPIFEGPIYRSGSEVPIDQLGPHPTVLECGGPVMSEWSPRRRTRHEVLWILWKWHWDEEEWVEVARVEAASSRDTEVLRAPAFACLNPRPELFDILTRARSVSEELLKYIDERLDKEPEEILMEVYQTIYDKMAGKIANCG